MLSISIALAAIYRGGRSHSASEENKQMGSITAVMVEQRSRSFSCCEKALQMLWSLVGIVVTDVAPAGETGA